MGYTMTTDDGLHASLEYLVTLHTASPHTAYSHRCQAALDELERLTTTTHTCLRDYHRAYCQWLIAEYLDNCKWELESERT